MSDLTVLLLILLTEIVNKHNYAFMQRKHELYYTRDDFSPAFMSVYMHYYGWQWSERTGFSWNNKCSPLSQKIQTPLLCSKGEDLQSLSWCKVLTASPEHEAAKWSLWLPKTPVVPYQTVSFQFDTALLYDIQRWYTHILKIDLNWKFKRSIK